MINYFGTSILFLFFIWLHFGVSILNISENFSGRKINPSNSASLVFSRRDMIWFWYSQAPLLETVKAELSKRYPTMWKHHDFRRRLESLEVEGCFLIEILRRSMIWLIQKWDTLQGINICHIGKFGKSSTQNAIFGGYVIVPWRVSSSTTKATQNITPLVN